MTEITKEYTRLTPEEIEKMPVGEEMRKLVQMVETDENVRDILRRVMAETLK